MIISNSAVDMSSQRSSFSYASRKTVVLEERAGAAIKLDLSADADSLMKQVENHEEEKEKAQKELEKQSQEQMMKQFKEQMVKDKERATNHGMFDDFAKTQEDMQVRLLRLILRSLSRALKKGAHNSDEEIEEPVSKPTQNRSTSFNNCLTIKPSSSTPMEVQPATLEKGNFRIVKMVKTTVTSAFEMHSENTAFQAQGQVHTKDGRSIDFGVTLELSQSFCREFEGFSQQSSFFVDPLIINFDTDSASISDQKFLFDLDCDGKKDEISFANQGSGFLALDKNDDGVINDGSELFGTKSGDGFDDLAKYDLDGNGWIDEADDIFSKLKIWTKDENGKDKLIDLKAADVGAIYLGSANTQFSLYNTNDYSANAMIRKTGVFLKESGGVGTMQHVDLAL